MSETSSVDRYYSSKWDGATYIIIDRINKVSIAYVNCENSPNDPEAFTSEADIEARATAICAVLNQSGFDYSPDYQKT